MIEKITKRKRKRISKKTRVGGDYSRYTIPNIVEFTEEEKENYRGNEKEKKRKNLQHKKVIEIMKRKIKVLAKPTKTKALDLLGNNFKAI